MHILASELQVGEIRGKKLGVGSHGESHEGALLFKVHVELLVQHAQVLHLPRQVRQVV